MKIAYVCTNYNNSSFTIGAVNSLMSNAGHDIAVFVVDNASSPDEVALLRPLAERYASVEVIENSRNSGYFAGLNIGLSALRRQCPDIEWAIVGNNDLEFAPDFCTSVERITEALRAHSVISPDIVTLDGEHQNPHVIAGISTVRELFYDLYYANYHLGRLIYKLAKMFPHVSERADERQWQVAQPIYQGHGSCYLLTPRFFAQFTELWSPTFMMSEEFFLSRQLKQVGEQVYYEPRIRVRHHWHGSLQKVPGRRRWEMERAAHREYRKYVQVLRRD